MTIPTGHVNTRWLNADPCGLICATIVWGLLGYASYVRVDKKRTKEEK